MVREDLKKVLMIFLIAVSAGISISLFSKPFIEVFTENVLKARISYLLAVVIILSFFVYLIAVFGRANRRRLVVPHLPFLLAYMVVSSLTNILLMFQNNDFNSRWLLMSLSLPMIFIMLSSILHQPKHLEYILYFCLAAALGMVILMTFTDAQGNFPSLGGVLQSRYRVYFLGSDKGPVSLATISSICLLLSIGLFLMSDQKIVSIVTLISMIFSLIGLIASGGRMAWISTLLCASLLVMFALGNEIKKKKVFLIVGLPFFLFIGISLLPMLLNRTLVTRRIEKMSIALSTPSDDVSLALRYLLWNEAIKITIDNPFGIGYDTFTIQHGLSTHSEYLNILLGSGIIGFSFYYLFWGLNFLEIFKAATLGKQAENSSLILIVFVLLLDFVFVSITEAFSSSNSFTSLLFWMILTVGAVAARRRRTHPVADKLSEKGI